MSDKNIFIHIPKTGGTTLDCAIHGTEWIQGKNEFNYRHIVHETKMSNAGDIFRVENLPKYSEYTLYTMLRHPVDKLISEYYFVRDRKEYFSLIKRRPKNLIEYAKNAQTQNSTLNFLLGKRFYPTTPATEDDLAKVIRIIDELSIHVGIFEEFEKSLEFFRDKLNFDFPSKIDVKRVTLNRPGLDEIDEETKRVILEHNKLDLELYEYCKAKLDQSNIEAKSYTISKDRYEYIMKYTERFNLLVLFVPKSSFLTINAQYFQSLNLFIHDRVSFTQGKSYVTLFNKMLCQDVGTKSPAIKAELAKVIKEQDPEDPLKTTEIISKLVAKYAIVKRATFKKPLNFNPNKYSEELLHVEGTPDSNKEINPASFFSKLFGK